MDKKKAVQLRWGEESKTVVRTVEVSQYSSLVGIPVGKDNEVIVKVVFVCKEQFDGEGLLKEKLARFIGLDAGFDTDLHMHVREEAWKRMRALGYKEMDGETDIS